MSTYFFWKKQTVQVKKIYYTCIHTHIQLLSFTFPNSSDTMKRRPSKTQSSTHSDTNNARQRKRLIVPSSSSSLQSSTGSNRVRQDDGHQRILTGVSSDIQVHKERSIFSETLHASEFCSAQLPSDHVSRPPTVIWHSDMTLALDQLNSEPEHAFAPPTTTTMSSGGGGEQLPKASDSLSLVNGPWYAQPFLDQVIKRGAIGYGSLHSQPGGNTTTINNNTTTHSGTPTRSTVTTRTNNRSNSSLSMKSMSTATNRSRKTIVDNLSLTQSRVLEEQSNGGRNFVTRVRQILRERGGRVWSLGEFMEELEHECAERLIHVSCFPKNYSDDRPPEHRCPDGKNNSSSSSSSSVEPQQKTLEVTLGYAIDMGGRYFIALRWSGLSWPSITTSFREQASTTQGRIKWVDIQFHSHRQRPEIIRYSCQCILG